MLRKGTLMTERESLLSPRRLRIVSHDIRLSGYGGDTAETVVVRVRLSSGDEIQMDITPDSIGNVYTGINWKRASGRWEKLVTCLNDGVREFIGRGQRSQL